MRSQKEKALTENATDLEKIAILKQKISELEATKMNPKNMQWHE